MRYINTFFFSVFTLILFGFGSLSAQIADLSTVLDARVPRQVITAYAQDQILQLEHLQKGATYIFVVPPDIALGSCLPDLSVIDQTVEMLALDGAKHSLRFKANSTSGRIKLHYACNWEDSNPPRHYVSISCLSCATPKKANHLADLAVLEVENDGAEALIREIFIGGDCFDVSNVTFSGGGDQIGKFTNGNTNIGFQNGLMLATGDIQVAPGPNNENGAGGGGAGGGDSDLGSIATGALFDIAVIEFDFTPTQSQLLFSYSFASEEYCEYVNTQFNDVFGFFISGPGIPGTRNLAVVPNTNTPVSINTINHVLNSTLYVHNTPAGLDNCEGGGVSGTLPPVPPSTGPATQELQYDGFTQEMIAAAEVIPCSTYHIKLAIGDVGDGVWDSAVFLKANSFDAGGNVSAFATYQNGQESAYEGCSEGSIRFVRGNNDLSQPLIVSFTVSGSSTATAGVDYAPLTSPVVIPIGQSELLVPVNVFSDGLTEGQENIRLLIDNNCQCQQAQVEFLINDSQLFTAQVIQDTTICEGFSATLIAETDGVFPPFTFEWSTGDTTQTIVVSPTVSTTFTVTVTDACGGTATADALVDVIPIIRDTVSVTLCPGGSIEINGVLYHTSGTVIDTSYETYFCGQITTFVITLSDPAQGTETISFCEGSSVEIGGQLYDEAGTVVDTLSTSAGCDSIVTYTLVVLPLIYGSDTISFCSGDSVEIGGQWYDGAGSVVDTLSTSAGCDSIVTYTLVVLPLTFGSDTLSFCPGDSVEIGGVFYSQSGTVIDTLTAVSGCDSIVTYTLIQLPQPTLLQLITFCPGESVVLGGTTYTQPTTVTLTLPGILGCDTIATYKLELLPEPTLFETIKFCPGENISLGGNVYTQPGIVVLTLPAAVGCDTIATYTLQYITPAPSTIILTCPHNYSVAVPSGGSGAVVSYSDPTGSTDCPCPGLDITRSSGLASGSTFPLGVSQVCYTAQDVCGQTKSCCFNITVAEEDPCDVKVNGCLKYELLTITQDQFKNKTYRVRVTNNCPNELIYTAIQTPSGLIAMAPADNSIYTAPSGNQYFVRNPNFSPFYSVRFRSYGVGIANGESDILRYTLPAQADVLFINITSKLYVQQFYEAHLNTFYCPVGVTPAEERYDEAPKAWREDNGSVLVFPNPSDGTIQVDVATWEGETVQMQVFNSQGQRVLFQSAIAGMEPQRVDLPKGVADGLYFLEVSTAAGEKEVVKFVVRH